MALAIHPHLNKLSNGDDNRNKNTKTKIYWSGEPLTIEIKVMLRNKKRKSNIKVTEIVKKILDI